MIRNYFLLNLLLIAIIGVLGNKFYHVLKYSAEMPAEAGEGEVRKEDMPGGYKVKGIDESIFETISAHDLFRPSRTAPLVEKKGAEKPQLPPPPKLFGTVILNENKTAILEQPDTKTTKVFRINDTVSGYKVLEIYEDKVVLLGNDERVEVRLRDDKGVQAPGRTTVRPPLTSPQIPQPGGQIQRPGVMPRQRARPVPPRRRPVRTVPPDNRNITPPETPQPQQEPEVPEAPEGTTEPAEEEAQ